MRSLISGLRSGFRILTGSPGLAWLAIGTLAAGIAAPTTMYSITSGASRNLPFEAPDEIVTIRLHRLDRNQRDIGFTSSDYRAWVSSQTSFESIAAVDRRSLNLTGAARSPLRLEAAAITPSAFEVLRVSPLLGRGMTASDAGAVAALTAWLGHRTWTRDFAADPSVVGSLVRVNGVTRTIVGVMPDGFEFPRREQLWIPLATYAGAPETNFQVFARLASGVPLDRARGESERILRPLTTSFPATHAGMTVTVDGYVEAEQSDEPILLMLYAMTAILAFVLIIACVNVANLLLARAITRSREVAVRMALGASRRRVIAELLLESAVLATLGGAAGVGLAYGAVAWFNAHLASEINLFWIVIKVDAPVLAFAGLLVATSTIIAGILPALQTSSVELTSAMKDGSPGSGVRSTRFSWSLVGLEIGLSCALLVLSSLLIRGVASRSERDPSYEPDGVYTARLDLENFEYPDAASRSRFIGFLEDRLSRSSAVRDVSISSSAPSGVAGLRDVAIVPGTGEALGRASRLGVSRGYFSTFNVELTQGRVFNTSDTHESLRVAIVNQEFVDRFLDGEAPLGKRVQVGAVGFEAPSVEVVGVVSNDDVFTARGQVYAGVMLPISQLDPNRLSLAVRAMEADPVELLPVMKEVIASINPDLPVIEEMSLREAMRLENPEEPVFAGLFAAFGLLAWIMAVAGLYGVVSYNARQRARELGIRQTLGATRFDVVWAVARKAVAPLAVGLVFGLIGALLAAPTLVGTLFGDSTTDPLIFLTVPLLLSISAFLAVLVPTIGISRRSPMSALRDV